MDLNEDGWVLVQISRRGKEIGSYVWEDSLGS